MQQLILIIHVLVSISLIALVLMQHGKGADIGAAFGSGGSQTLFGSQGPASFLMKLTALLGAIFFITSLTLTYFAIHARQQQSEFGVFPSVNQKQQTTVPNPVNKIVQEPVSPSMPKQQGDKDLQKN